jgi:uncharacterized repeat protein (TIGR02543 family)
MKSFDKKTMISLLLIFAILFNFIPNFISTSVAAQNNIFTDDFESYDVGTTVPSGGTAYTQIYNGTGNNNQAVISAEQKDGTTGNVLQLQGASGWSSQIKYSFTSDDKQYLIIEADVKPLSVNSPAGISLCSNSAGGYWTHSVCGIHMKNGGFNYGINDTGNSIDTDLTYTTGNWYRLSLVLDKTNHIFYNLLDGSLIGGRSFTADTATPEWIEFSSNNNGTNTAYFDNINLYSTDTFNFATVTFNSNGGSEVAAQTIIKGQKVEKPTAPTKSGLVFGGWYKEDGCINAWNFETDVVTETMTLYAKWDELITYPLWVGNTQVTNANQEDVLGDGKVTFDSSTNTLDFDDAKITSSTQTTLEGSRAYASILSKGIDLTITGKVKTSAGGDVAVLSKKDNGIGGNLIFDGDIYAYLSVRAENDLIINSGTVDAGMIVGYNSVTIKSDVSKVDSAGDIRGYTGITIEPPLEIQTGQTLKYNDEDNYYYIGHSSVSIYAPLVTTHNVKVSAINIDDYEELEGATLQVKDNTGKVIDEWVSTSASHEITGLNSDVEYTLEATVAPDGYIIPSKTTFTIASDGTITSTGSTSSDGVLLVEFEMTCVEIKCIKNSDSSLLSGVTIQILDENGNIVEEWSSSTVNHKVLGLITEKEYTLRVTSVPDEDLYNIPTDTTFTIDERGVITSTGSISGQTLLISVNETHIHNLTLVPAKDATCMAEGNNAYYTCSGCTKVFKDALGAVETTVAAETLDIDSNAHDWEDWIETTPATVDNEGVKTRICKNDSSHKETATIDRLPYAILEGDNQTFVIDSSKDISIKANGTFNKFLGLKMDGKDIESKFYTAVSGSTVVTLAQEYLNTLDEGEHILTFIYTDGTVDSTLKIAKASIPEEISNNQSNTETTNTSSSPKTGDNIIMYIAMMIISTIGVFGTIKFIKKKN